MKQLKLYPYQKEHVAEIKRVFTYAWFCLDQSLLGLGKTYTAAEISKSYTHLIVVAPLSVCGKWQSIKDQYRLKNVHSINTFNGIRSIQGLQPKHGLLYRDPDTDHTFEATQDYLDLFKNKQTVLLVIDEVQNIKNDSAQFYACKALADEIRTHKGSRLISISGSPIDKPEQSQRMFEFLGFFDVKPDMYPVIETFKQKVHKAENMDFRQNMSLFEGEFKNLFIRRMPIPDYKTKLTIENAYYPIVPKSDEADLERHVARFADLNLYYKKSKKDKIKILAQIMIIMQKIENAKANTMIMAAEAHLQANPSSKVVILFNYTDNIKRAVKKLKYLNPLMINGTITGVVRQKRLNLFQAPSLKHRLLIGNLSVLSTGIDLDDKNGAFPRFCIANAMLNSITLYQLGHRFRRIDTKSDALVQFVFGDQSGGNENFLLKNLSRKRDVLQGVADDQKAAGIPFPGGYHDNYINDSPMRAAIRRVLF